MHDDVEARVRSVLRKEGDDLTLNITAQELERRLAVRRRMRAGRRMRLVAAGIAVVAIGGIVIAGNGGFGTRPVVGGRPSANATMAGPSASLAPSPPEATSPGPAASNDDGQLPCDALDPSQASGPPPLVAAAMPGDAIGHGGTVVASEWAGRVSGTSGSWDGLPGDPDPVVIGRTNEVFEAVSDGCFVQVTAEALLTVYAEVPKPSPTPVPLAIVRGGVNSRVVDIAPPGVGGWTVRVRASFLTTDGSAAWSESLFRVLVPFQAPMLTMSLAGASGGISVDGNCPSFHLASGASAADQCGGPYEPITGIDPLMIPRGSSVVLVLADGWQLEQVKVTAVDADLVAAGRNAPEYSMAFEDKGGPKVTTAVVLDPGSWIVRGSLNGSRGEESFGAWYDLPVVVR
ncbi:MAG TPA: hypothetical protein VIU37_01570 [Candidatus Limnocylindrales bacterium]